MSPLEFPARIPPHNLDAERAVLGAVLLEGRETLPRVIEVLRASDFYTEAHRAIYQAMLALFDRGEPVDVLTLTEELRRSDQLQFVGGPASLALLVEQASIAAYLSSYTAIVRDMAVLRELLPTSSQILAQTVDRQDGLRPQHRAARRHHAARQRARSQPRDVGPTTGAAHAVLGGQGRLTVGPYRLAACVGLDPAHGRGGPTQRGADLHRRQPQP